MTDEVKKYLDEFLQAMEVHTPMAENSREIRFSSYLSEEAMKITFELNSAYHTPKQVNQLFSQLIGKKVEYFKLHPPFYTDCGKNIKIGKGVFINSCCNFQDQGGITIGDNVQIGHNVILTTLNHDLASSTRRTVFPSPIFIEDNVWIGSGSIITPGVTIGKNSCVAAGSVVIEDVPANVLVAGNPAQVKKQI